MPLSLPSTFRCLFAAAVAAALMSGCVQVPVDGNHQEALAPGTTSAADAVPVAPVVPLLAKPPRARPVLPGVDPLDGTVASMPPASEDPMRMSDERRGLGLVPPPSGPMSSIDGISRPWDVPDLPKNLKQDPYRPSDQQGMASWYGGEFHGRKTANGERFDKSGLTAAHKTLPFGTQLCVRSMVTGKSVVVRVNDRGPYAGDRIIDLSQGAAAELGMLGLGIKPVEFWTLDEDEDDCPSFVLAGRRGAGRLAGAHAHRGSKQLLVHDRSTGRVRETIPVSRVKAAAVGKPVSKAGHQRSSQQQRRKK